MYLARKDLLREDMPYDPIRYFSEEHITRFHYLLRHLGISVQGLQANRGDDKGYNDANADHFMAWIGKAYVSTGQKVQRNKISQALFLMKSHPFVCLFI
jgi:hypothetical protein